MVGCYGFDENIFIDIFGDFSKFFCFDRDVYFEAFYECEVEDSDGDDNFSGDFEWIIFLGV